MCLTLLWPALCQATVRVGGDGRLELDPVFPVRGQASSRNVAARYQTNSTDGPIGSPELQAFRGRSRGRQAGCSQGLIFLWFLLTLISGSLNWLQVC